MIVADFGKSFEAGSDGMMSLILPYCTLMHQRILHTD